VIVFPTLLLVILGSIPYFREPIEGMHGVRLIDLYVPTIVVLAMITASLQSMPPTLVGYRERGVLRRLAVTPTRPLNLLGAQVVAHAAAIVVATAVALAVAGIAFHVPLPQQFLGWLLAYGFVMVAALALGSLIAAVSPSAKLGATFGAIVFFPSMFTAGVWIPLNVMPDTMRTLVEYTPMGAGTQAITEALTGSWPSSIHLLVMAA